MVGSTQKFNRPIAPEYKNFNRRRRMMKQRRKKNKGVKVIPVADPELMTRHILRKRATNPRANVTLSGKKRNKILKKLRRIESEKLQMEVEVTGRKSKHKQKTAKKTDTTQQSEDVDMEEA